MKSYPLIGTLLLIVSSPVVQSFVAQHTSAITTTKLMQKATTQLSATGNPLFLHVEPLHPHRDSVVRLDDPIMLEKLTEDENHVDKDKALHRFTTLIAPIALALYLIGHYLSTYHASDTAALVDGVNSIELDPMFGGYVLIGAGLLMSFMAKWTIDQTFLSPV
eukprot:CAMPEP_0201867816 /NCGR_PEP_ID=MMETSP0902-20130614/1935_1 /ASSEMBLY_ACC=CAM_ASM_000551 /TAXON_ID=420261 /ORGANISM="Thalassiosira antarctica, Strain CCMP982" /LENGTH=162 /DNA_ID=CAMNT_0048393055 /DNA_START=42 /DNA_END=530 /DNA_ORIENTATION=+